MADKNNAEDDIHLEDGATIGGDVFTGGKQEIHTEGGAYIEGPVDTGGGDVVGRDKITNIIQQSKSKAQEAREQREYAKELVFEAVAEYAGALLEDFDEKTQKLYPGLSSYELTDQGCFFGRTQAVKDLLKFSRGVARREHLVVLHGESGSGKTSLLQAGFAPQLIKEGHLPLHIRVHDSPPAERLKKELFPNVNNEEALRDLSLAAFLRIVEDALESEKTLFIFLDQFEEFFLSGKLGASQRLEFIRELRDCLEDKVLGAHFFIVIRSDHFYRLSEFKQANIIPWIFKNEYPLKPLSTDEARDVLVEPMGQKGLHYDPGLVEEIIADIGQQDILPAQLQLVCQALYRSLEPGQQMITRQQYQAQGGVEGILKNHLNRVLSNIEREVHTPDDKARLSVRDLANYILVSLVERTPVNRRRRRTLEDLLADARVDELLLQSVLNELVSERLLQVTAAEPAGQATYELTHDSLIEQIAADNEIAILQNAMDLLNNEINICIKGEEIEEVMTPGRLTIIETQANRLRLDAKALDLLFHSALTHGRSLDIWRDYALDNRLTAALAERWVKILKGEDDNKTEIAIHLLVKLSDVEVVSRLIDLVKEHSPSDQKTPLHSSSVIQLRALNALAQMENPEAEIYLRGLTPDGFCFVPAGPFDVGSNIYDDEQPLHRVTLSAFWIARSPVTIADWRTFIEAGVYTQPEYWQGFEQNGLAKNFVSQHLENLQDKSTHPVGNLTWYEAMVYAAWFVEKSCLPVSLPTEVEWEKAAAWNQKTGLARSYPWGDDPDTMRCNVQKDGFSETIPVGQYSPTGDSSCGVQDMAGNILEWTHTIYRIYPYNPEDGRENTTSDDPRVLRGGAFNRDITDARCARRLALDPAIALSSTGCRVCLRLLPLAAGSDED